jgi:hypothetical protein
VLAPPYKRATLDADTRWVQESLVRQMFQDHLDRDEVKIAVSEAALTFPGSDGRPVHAWLMTTDRALHARVTLGAGIFSTLTLGYQQVKFVEASEPDETTVQVAYFNPRRAVDESWRLRLDPAVAAPAFAAHLVHVVSQYHAAVQAAAAARAADATRRSSEAAWTVAVAAARTALDAPAAAVGPAAGAQARPVGSEVA